MSQLAERPPAEREARTHASTAEAASLAAAEPDTAAIAGEQAAVNHGLDVLARNIEDNPDNVTRFAVIGAKAADRTGHDKTALVFEAPHQPGALADAMAIFKRQRLNLTWIESFPIPQARGRYLFFLEFQGHPTDAAVKRAIAALEKKSLRLVVLGLVRRSRRRRIIGQSAYYGPSSQLRGRGLWANELSLILLTIALLIVILFTFVVFLLLGRHWIKAFMSGVPFRLRPNRNAVAGHAARWPWTRTSN